MMCAVVVVLGCYLSWSLSQFTNLPNSPPVVRDRGHSQVLQHCVAAGGSINKHRASIGTHGWSRQHRE